MTSATAQQHGSRKSEQGERAENDDER